MYCTRNVTADLVWVGADDRRLACFEGVYGVPDGVSYNSYLLRDEKTVLFDTVDKAVSRTFFENVAHELQGRSLDYLVVSHMEPDHAATIEELTLRYPEVCIVCNDKIKTMLGQFFTLSDGLKYHIVKEGDTLSTGRHELTFVMAPMVHWPEVMMTYDTTDKILFSADAFGTFGALSGNIFADEVNFERDWLDDARRYYANIVGKYGAQVQALLKKAAGLDIAYLCPLHGPIWRENIGWFVEKYQTWSTYAPENKTAAIFCGSIYGHTENAADIVANRLAEQGVKEICLYDVSKTDVSVLVSEAFRCSHLVLASATYNGAIFTPMENFLLDLKAHNLQNRTVAVIDNGSWSAQAGRQMRELVGAMKNMTVLEDGVSLKSSVKETQRAELEALADTLAADILA